MMQVDRRSMGEDGVGIEDNRWKSGECLCLLPLLG